MTMIQCPDCGDSPRSKQALPLGSLITCDGCGTQFRVTKKFEPSRSTFLSDRQAFGAFVAIGLALIIAYWVGKSNVPDPKLNQAPDVNDFANVRGVLQPVPGGSKAPEDVAKALRATVDPAVRLALIEAGRVVVADSPTTKDCRRLLDPVSSAFQISREEAAQRVIAEVKQTEAEGDRFGPLQVLDAADLYTHSPRFRGGQRNFDSFLVAFDEVRRSDKNRSEIPERMVRLQ